MINMFKQYKKQLLKEVQLGIMMQTTYDTTVYTLTKPIRQGAVTGSPLDLVNYLTVGRRVSDFMTGEVLIPELKFDEKPPIKANIEEFAKNTPKNTILCTYSHVSKFWDFLIENHQKIGPNPYVEFRKKRSKTAFFKPETKPNIPPHTMTQAEFLIGQLSNEQYRKKALELLHTGMRFSESLTFEKGYILGKGGKKRRIKTLPKYYDASYFTGSYSGFVKALRKVGLKPHDLRKIYSMTRARQGVNAYQIKAELGHSSILTSQFYIDLSMEEVA